MAATGLSKGHEPGHRRPVRDSAAISDDGRVLAVGAIGEDGLSTGINGDQEFSQEFTQESGSSWHAGAVYLY